VKNIKIFILILTIFNFSYSNLFTEENLSNKIYKNLRCLVCQGQSIADSNSDFAQTIKSVVSDKLQEGMNEKQIYNFLSDKYGDWILYKPPLKSESYLLWMLPYMFFILGAIVLFFLLKKTLKHKRY
tara:strand:- start:1194 stop:1574 length:381 start_codon:yes stop_codon:yes gene_type:complete